jgi:hypothetical protein
VKLHSFSAVGGYGIPVGYELYGNFGNNITVKPKMT